MEGSMNGSGAALEALAGRVQRLEDLMAIHQLFVDYGRYLDAGDIDAYASLFSEDAELLLGPLGRAKGRAAIRELMGRALAGQKGSSVHIVGSPQVQLDGERATATVLWSVITRTAEGGAALTMVGHHADELRREPGGWRFVRRKGYVDLPSALPRPPSS
jgi:uncharacterized protein (TIGR02246 family)